MLFSYAVYDNRSVELFPPKISAKEASPSSNPHGPIAQVSDCIAKSEVEAHYVATAIVERDYIPRQHSTPSEWRYFAMPNQGGGAVQDRLNQIQPPPDGLVIAYDGSANNTFHVWYRGSGSGASYTYVVGTANDLRNPPTRTFFLADQTRVPAGIGGLGGVAVPIYFEVTAGSPLLRPHE